MNDTTSSATSNVSLVLDPNCFDCIADQLIEKKFSNGGQLTLRRFHEAFWQWTGRRYTEMRDEELKNKIRRFLKAAMVQEKRTTEPFNPSTKEVNEVFNALMEVTELHNAGRPPMWTDLQTDWRPDGLPPARELFAVRNGLLHLPTRKLFEPDPRFFNFAASEADYDEGASCPNFEKFLETNVEDGQSIELLQDWLGYLISGDTSQHKILLGYGPRRSGRSTFAKIVTGLVGEDSVGTPSAHSIGERFGLQNLIDKTVGIIADFQMSRHSNVGQFQEIVRRISGEDPVPIDRKHKSQIDVLLPVRLMFLTNTLFRSMGDESGALVGRYLVLKFPHSFYGKEDIELPGRILAEMSGILNFALKGYDRMRERKRFIQPGCSKEEIHRLEALGDPIKAFVQEDCVLGADYSEHKDRLYKQYEERCKNRGIAPENKVWFSRKLFEAYPEVRESRNAGVREYAGIKLADEIL